MARWTDMSYRRYSHNRNDEVEREVDNYLDCDVISYGLIEDVNKNNCYGVEDVYADLDSWN